MVRKLELENIEGFNDFDYKSCFYHALFSTVTYFKKSLLPFLANDIYVYQYQKDIDNNSFRFYLKEKNINTHRELLESMDIWVESKIINNNALNDTITALSKGRPVILLVDCYYLQLRVDKYQKEHCPHTILVYGYNEDDKTFNTVDIAYPVSKLYEKHVITYSEFTDAYQGFIDNFMQNFETDGDEIVIGSHYFNKADFPPSYSEYYLNQEQAGSELSSQDEINKYLQGFIDNIVNEGGGILDGLQQLNLFIEEFEKITSDDSILKNHSDNILELLNEVVRIKVMDRYRLSKLFGTSSEIIQLAEEIAGYWSFVRAIVAKYQYSSEYQPKSFQASIDKLLKIYQAEEKIYNTITNCA